MPSWTCTLRLNPPGLAHRPRPLSGSANTGSGSLVQGSARPAAKSSMSLRPRPRSAQPSTETLKRLQVRSNTVSLFTDTQLMYYGSDIRARLSVNQLINCVKLIGALNNIKIRGVLFLMLLHGMCRDIFLSQTQYTTVVWTVDTHPQTTHACVCVCVCVCGIRNRK